MEYLEVSLQKLIIKTILKNVLKILSEKLFIAKLNLLKIISILKSKYFRRDETSLNKISFIQKILCQLYHCKWV